MANETQVAQPNDLGELEEILAQLDPETRRLLATMGTAPDRMALAGAQAGPAAALMATPGAQGANVGGTYRAASPLEHLSVALQRGLGGKMQRDALAGQRDVLGQVDAGRSAFMGLGRGATGDALRQQRALAVLGAMTGDPVLSAVGRQLGDRADLREGRAYSQAEALQKALLEDRRTHEQRTWQEGRDEKSQAAALERANVLAGYVDARRQGDLSRRTWIGEDFESTGGAREIAPAVLADAQKQIVDARRILSNVDRVDSLLERNPNGALIGDDAVKLQTLVEGIKLREKEIQGLGVLNGQDYEILSRIVADPTSMKEALKSGAGVRPLRTAFQALRDLTHNDVSQMSGSLGFSPRTGSPFAPRGRSTGSVTVIWKGKRKTIPADRLEEALAAGAEEVE